MTKSPGSDGSRQSPARARILDAASRHFYADGIAATGIDVITASAGVAKMSLYNNFASKAALVEAYIDVRHEEWLGLYRARIADTATAQERVLAVFDAYIDHAAAAYDHGFRGCGLLNAAAELGADDPARTAVRRHKEQVERLLAEHLSTLTDPSAAQRLAERLSFLLEGAMARAGLEGKSTRLLHAREFAAEMLTAL
ncbi:AcrR family transcriptional regulator [Arthrobacter sp. V4I6]|uniref:TetR/AcrR family transcriptional regulator n=1 Tax=unclassified Arthrobacter TaxID=235627 RepID=UPI00277FE84C|nr:MULTISPECIES: TetR/AcrR family transcriptional regulator [unclassified Arthrobacter]MDQ0820804.1 AcrR family transcriptional regulator [Arthrobacter sp. V1I7]MDQ0855066.1 AcrR family transcriptional regulator [Arthrobacter sp. V4I6]